MCQLADLKISDADLKVGVKFIKDRVDSLLFHGEIDDEMPLSVAAVRL